MKPYISPFILKERFEEQFVHSGMNFTVDELEPTTEYEIKVAAYSGKEMGHFASLRQFTLPADEKGEVRILHDNLLLPYFKGAVLY